MTAAFPTMSARYARGAAVAAAMEPLRRGAFAEPRAVAAADSVTTTSIIAALASRSGDGDPNASFPLHLAVSISLT